MAMATARTQRRNAQTVPRLGTEEQMKAEALEQIKARVAYQKELMRGKDPKHQVEEEIHEMYKWVKVTFMFGLPICVASLIFSFATEEHAHRPEGALPEYLAIRKKEFPWECGDCALFDLDCWKKCRAEKA
jgi:cytochrome c oxidase subunit 6a